MPAATLAALFPAASAWAAPTATIQPYDGARFAVGQRFDIRVEAQTTTGSAPATVQLKIDNKVVPFSSENDSFTTTGYYGYNRRGAFIMSAGNHTITATVTDSTGTSTVVTHFEVINPYGWHRPAKNIIVLLGDGMGVAHRTAARLVKYGETNGRYNGYLAMDKMKTVGMVNTGSLNSIITDSAPGMATYVSGNKANNNQEGVFPAHVTNAFYAPRVEYLSEYLHRTLGKSTGIVTTADIEDATPAANAIHTANRNAGQGVCDQYLDESSNNGLTVLMGGGRRWFLPSSVYGSSRSSSNDYAGLPSDLASAWGIPTGSIDPDRNLINDFTNSGFTYVDNRTDLLNTTSATKLIGLFGYGNMNTAYDKVNYRRGTDPNPTPVVQAYHAPDQPMLDEMANAALNILNKNSNGFYLMIEGAHIDKQSHLMDADRAIWETIEFDNAIQKCIDFANTHEDTLVIVTADHECSGFSIIGALTGGINNLKNLPSDSNTLSPTSTPARQNVVGTYDAAGFPHYTILADGYPATADIDGKLLIGYGASGDRFEDWLSKPVPVIDTLLPNVIKSELASQGYGAEPINRYSNGGEYLRGQVPGGQATHTASDIELNAYSTGSNTATQFQGEQDNTDVFFKLLRAAFGRY